MNNNSKTTLVAIDVQKIYRDGREWCGFYNREHAYSKSRTRVIICILPLPILIFCVSAARYHDYRDTKISRHRIDTTHVAISLFSYFCYTRIDISIILLMLQRFFFEILVPLSSTCRLTSGIWSQFDSFTP